MRRCIEAFDSSEVTNDAGGAERHTKKKWRRRFLSKSYYLMTAAYFFILYWCYCDLSFVQSVTIVALIQTNVSRHRTLHYVIYSNFTNVYIWNYIHTDIVALVIGFPFLTEPWKHCLLFDILLSFEHQIYRLAGLCQKFKMLFNCGYGNRVIWYHLISFVQE